MPKSLVAARTTFGMTLVFHVVFASSGVLMPFMILRSQWSYLRRGDRVYEVGRQRDGDAGVKSRRCAVGGEPEERGSGV